MIRKPLLKIFCLSYFLLLSACVPKYWSSWEPLGKPSETKDTFSLKIETYETDGSVLKGAEVRYRKIKDSFDPLISSAEDEQASRKDGEAYCN
jgi:hypothetical protein